MADPTKYVPGYDYEAWEAANPTKPKPGLELDNDFANIALSIGQCVDAIKNVRRSDGALRNGIVTKDSLASDVQDILATAGGVQLIRPGRDLTGDVEATSNLNTFTFTNTGRLLLQTVFGAVAPYRCRVRNKSGGVLKVYLDSFSNDPIARIPSQSDGSGAGWCDIEIDDGDISIDGNV